MKYSNKSEIKTTIYTNETKGKNASEQQEKIEQRTHCKQSKQTMGKMLRQRQKQVYKKVNAVRLCVCVFGFFVQKSERIDITIQSFCISKHTKTLSCNGCNGETSVVQPSENNILCSTRFCVPIRYPVHIRTGVNTCFYHNKVSSS